MAAKESLFEFQTDEKSLFKLTSYSPDPDIIQCTGNSGAKLTVKPGIKAQSSWAATYNQSFKYQAEAVPSTDTPEIENRKITIIIQGATKSYNKAGNLFTPNGTPIISNVPITLSLDEVTQKDVEYAFAANSGVIKVELRGSYNANWYYIDDRKQQHFIPASDISKGVIVYAAKIWMSKGYDPALSSATYDITVNDKRSTIITYTK